MVQFGHANRKTHQDEKHHRHLLITEVVMHQPTRKKTDRSAQTAQNYPARPPVVRLEAAPERAGVNPKNGQPRMITNADIRNASCEARVTVSRSARHIAASETMSSGVGE